MAYIIGLTGNIACGKSLVLAILRRLGAEVVDADEVAHDMMAVDGPAYRRIIKTFGEDVLTPAQDIDRRKLGQIVFRDPEQLAKLEGIVHPLVTKFIAQKVWRSSEQVVVIDAIKLLESDLIKFVDSVWVVTCKREQQIQRLVEDREFTRQEAELRVNAQPPQEEKIAKANVIIDNGGTIEETKEQVIREWEKVIEGLER